tara:strand:+ start:7042 stop:7917 length:876 start_codon:yes stop_codon:yes gene_type:complete
MENTPQIKESDSENSSVSSLDLMVEIYSIFNKRLKFLLSSFIFLVVCLVTYSLVVEESYRASVLINHAESNQNGLSTFSSQLGGLSSLAGFNISPEESKKNVNIATIKSRVFLEDFINSSEITGELLSGSSYTATSAPDWFLYKTLRNTLNIQEDLKTGLVTLSVDWKNPEIAADWANKLVSHINNKSRLQDIEEAKLNISFLEKEIQKTKLTEVQNLMYDIMQKQTEKMMLANVKKEYAFKIINPAYPPELRFYPKRTLMVIVGTILGSIGLVFIVFFFEFLNRFKKKIG